MKKILKSLTVTVSLLASLVNVHAVPDFVVNTFESAGGETLFEKWWGDALASSTNISLDTTVNAPEANATSGAMKVDLLYADDPANQWSIRKLTSPTGANWDATKYTHIEMDIRYDPTSTLNVYGDHGWLEFGFVDADWGQIYAFQGSIPASASTSWFHISAPIPYGANKINNVQGIHFKLWGGGNADVNKLRGPATFWVDNIKLIGVPDNVPEVKPTTTITKAGAPGLRLVAATDDQYHRQSIHTANRTYSWVNQTFPVSYTIGIAEYPANTADFQVHMYIVPFPDSRTGGPISYPDWGDEDVAFASIAGNGTGGGYMSMRYKLDTPNGNGNMYGEDNGTTGGTLATVGSAKVLGDWTVTFTSNTNFTLTAPDGTTAPGAFTEAAAAQFTGPAYFYAGIVPGSNDRRYKGVTFSNVSLLGFPISINDNFQSSNSLDPMTWIFSGNAANAVMPIVAAEAPLWLEWSLPTPGFVLQYSGDLTTWGPFPDTNGFGMNGKRHVLINKSWIPEVSPKDGFWRLQKP